jgi:phosphatidylglycerol:prolipoprotein diacylglycerol transferase
MAIILPDFDPIALQIGPIALRWYALAYVGGIIAGWKLSLRLLRLYNPKTLTITAAQIDDFILWLTLGIIVGGRLGYVGFYQLDFFLDNPAAILKTWQGGMSFHGGLLGVVIAVLGFCRWHRINPLLLGDLAATVATIGLGLGRLANFINGELYGRVTDVPWAMIFASDPQRLPRHASQLYQALTEGLILFIVCMAAMRLPRLRQAYGSVFGIFLASYGVLRFLVEFTRQPDAQLGLNLLGLSRGQMLCLPMVVLGLAFLGYAQWRHHRTPLLRP